MNYLVTVTAMPFSGLDRGTMRAMDVREKSPEAAILRWCEYSKKYPTCVSIQPSTRNAGLVLLKWASENIEKVRAYLTENNSPYRIEWMLKEILKQAGAGKTSMQRDGDQLHPFSIR